jgi:transcriptional regulator with XRE-family HTH domain
MRVGLTVEAETSLGFKAKKLRRSLRLTQQELANLAGVPTKEVSLFEHNMPVQLDVKRKLLRELWAIGKC